MESMTDSIKKNENKIHAAAGDRKIIRRLRIKFCAIMMIIVVAFLAVVFTVQYISNKRTMDEQSENALRMAIDRVDRQNSGEFTPDMFVDPDGTEIPDGMNIPDGTNPPDGINPPDGDGTGNENATQDGKGKTGIFL